MMAVIEATKVVFPVIIQKLCSETTSMVESTAFRIYMLIRKPTTMIKALAFLDALKAE